MRSTDFYILATIGNRLTDLVIDPAGGEIRKSGGIGNLSANSKSGCNTNHIGFCNTALDKTFRKFLNKLVQLHRTQQVCSERNDIGISAGCFHDAISETAAGVFTAGRLNIF